MHIKKIISAVLLLSIMVFPHVSHAQAFNPAFNPSQIIDDKVFSDIATFGGPEGIQKFLESKGSVLANTSPDFLQKLKEPTITILKQGLDDPHPDLGRLRTAAELIWDAAQSSGMNPQVILVTLNKEQSLITGRQTAAPDVLQKALDRALGFDCPDAAGCGNLFPGFYYQLFGNFDAAGNRYLGATKSLMKSFNTVGGRGPSINGAVAHVGDTITLDNTLGGYDGVQAQQQVQIGNNATAALYRYTPHVFNGNYNFWKFFNEWFRYPNGTILKLSGDANTYIIQNGYRLVLPNFVAQARGLNVATAVTVSQNEIDGYPQNKVYGPADNTVVTVEGNTKKYVFVNNVKRPASDFVLSQRGLSTAPVLSITAAEAQMFDDGPMLTPSDGSVIRGQTKPEIYLVQNGSLKLFSKFTFEQLKVAKQVQLVPDAEIDSYPKSGFVAPLNGTVVKTPTNNTVYVIQDGLKRPISGAIYKLNGYKASQVVVLSDDEVNGFVIGAFMTPKERSVFKVDTTGKVYLFKEGQTHLVSSFVQKQRGITPDVTVPASEAVEWSDGTPIPPANGTVVKGDKSQTVYLVDSAQLKPLTAAAFKARKISAKSVKILPQDEVDAYTKGDTLVK